MQRGDLTWAQNVVERWAIREAVPAPKVTTILTSKEKLLSGYKINTIVLNEKAWDMLKMDGKILLLAQPFSYHVQYAFGTDTDDEKAHELALELVLYEIELWSDATGVKMTRLMNIKSVSKLISLLDQRHARVQ